MKILKVLNSSVVLVNDDHNQEFILLAKGIGYGKKAGDEIEEPEENQIFLAVDNIRSKQITELLNSISVEILEVTQKIVSLAQERLQAELNKNLVFVLADHLNFAIERNKSGIKITNRVFWEIKSFYPAEFKLGLASLSIIKDDLNVVLPEEEAANIAFHLANSESGDNPEYDAARYAKLTGEVLNLVRYSFNRDYDTSSIHYVRFLTHIKFFAERYFTGRMLQNEDTLLYDQMCLRYPNETEIAQKINHFLKEKYGHELTLEEITFLVVHINRMKSSQK